jgi:hypothetical protein
VSCPVRLLVHDGCSLRGVCACLRPIDRVRDCQRAERSDQHDESDDCVWGRGHVGGEQLLCPNGDIPIKQISSVFVTYAASFPRRPEP